MGSTCSTQRKQLLHYCNNNKRAHRHALRPLAAPCMEKQRSVRPLLNTNAQYTCTNPCVTTRYVHVHTCTYQCGAKSVKEATARVANRHTHTHTKQRQLRLASRAYLDFLLPLLPLLLGRQWIGRHDRYAVLRATTTRGGSDRRRLDLLLLFGGVVGHVLAVQSLCGLVVRLLLPPCDCCRPGSSLCLCALARRLVGKQAKDTSRQMAGKQTDGQRYINGWIQKQID
jgi:hypothetical protein